MSTIWCETGLSNRGEREEWKEEGQRLRENKIKFKTRTNYNK